MFCEKCGAQLPDGAKFCEKCGSSTVPGAAPAPAAAAVASAAAPAAPSAFSLALKKFFSNKRNVIIAAVALFLVIAAIVTIIIIASQPKKIYIDDYFHVVFEGVDGNGRAYLSTSDEENKKFVKLNKKIFGDDADEKSIGMYIEPYIDMTEEELNSLKNGQKIKVKLKINKDIYDEVDGYKFVLRHKTVKVKGLYKSTQLNVLDYITPMFGGYTGYGMPQSLDTLVFPLINGTEARVTHQGHRLRIEIYETKNNSYISTVYARFDRYEHLSNGDTVNLSIEASENDTSSLYSGYGLILASQTKSFTVSGLAEPTYTELAKYVNFKFTGMSTVATMNFDVTKEEVMLGSFKVKLSNPYASSEYASQLRTELYNSEGKLIRTIIYYADKCTKIKNGDKIKFETSVSIEEVLSNYGISFPQSFEVDVTGLTEPFNADPTSRGTYVFEGYQGYGMFVFDLPEANRVYKTDDGKYTIKLSFDKSYNYRITVVVADENGRNFLSFSYDCYPSSTLKNGDIIEFYCSEWEGNLESYVKDYGLYFPHKVTYTVEGLKETTTVNPLENLTFSFAKDGDYVKMTLGLKEKTVAYGENALNYFLETYSSWGDKYTKINITVKDKDGNLIDAGFYEFKTDHLNEGDKLYPSNHTDNASVTIATGIIFNVDDYFVIVSSQ